MSMPTHNLPLWKTLVHALRAPFSLETASWKALSVPVLATIVSSLLPVAVNRLQWSTTAVWLVVMLLIWVALAWLALEFQRHILLGAAACRANAQPWHRYGLYLVAVVVAGTIFAVFLGFCFLFDACGITLVRTFTVSGDSAERSDWCSVIVSSSHSTYSADSNSSSSEHALLLSSPE